jgi:hypothetical protein
MIEEARREVDEEIALSMTEGDTAGAVKKPCRSWHTIWPSFRYI